MNAPNPNAAILGMLRDLTKEVTELRQEIASIKASVGGAIGTAPDRKLEAIAAALGLVHVKVANGDPLPAHVLVNPVFREFALNYPVGAPRADGLGTDNSLLAEVGQWSSDVISGRLEELEIRLAAETTTPLDILKARRLQEILTRTLEARTASPEAAR
jgi:hypothetical protein